MKSVLRYKIVSTEQQAKQLCLQIASGLSAYMRKNHPPRYQIWESSDKEEKGFIVFYQETPRR